MKNPFCFKILYLDNHLYIEKYKKILGVSDSLIHLEGFIITGKNLKIIQMDKYLLEIEGEIIEIRRENNEHL